MGWYFNNMIHTATDLRALTSRISENRAWDGVSPRSVSTQAYNILEDINCRMVFAVKMEMNTCEVVLASSAPDFNKVRDVVVKRLANSGFHMDIAYSTRTCTLNISW
jgi:hypothetical protein